MGRERDERKVTSDRREHGGVRGWIGMGSGEETEGREAFEG